MTTLRPRRAFTLVEMLVVIGIISVLAALLLPAVMIAVRTARNAAIAVEINQLASAIESYKQDKGDYPPNFRDSSVVLRHIRKCFPKADPTYVNNFVTYACALSAATSKNMFIDDGEALVFWLSLTDNDPRYPFLSYYNPNNQTASPKKYYPFDDTQLADLDATEAQLINGVGQFYDIRACRGKYSKDSYYLYIDSRSYDDTCRINGGNYSDGSNSYAYSEDSTLGSRPYWSATLATGAAANDPNRKKYKPMNATTFQIICAGQDGDYGGNPTVTTDVKLFPSGLNYDLAGADKDNITNFSAGKTLGDSLP